MRAVGIKRKIYLPANFFEKPGITTNDAL